MERWEQGIWSEDLIDARGKTTVSVLEGVEVEKAAVDVEVKV